MKRYSFFAFATLLLMTSVALSADCPKCRLQAAWGLAAQSADLFDPATVGRYEGTVLSVQEVAPAKGVVAGVYALLKTATGNMSVRLGPATYLQQMGFVVEPYDHLEVMASKVTTVSDHPALVATKAKLGDRTIALRNSDGKEEWSKK